MLEAFIDSSSNKGPPMPTSKPANHMSRTLLLAGDSKNTVLAEMAGGIHRFAYSPYGQQSSPQKVMTQLGFNGELREAKTDWYFLGKGYRVYNPLLMRFHSPDKFSPFGKGGMHAYMYCGGEPVMRGDPSGEAWILGGFWKVVSDTFADYVWPLFSPVGTGGGNAGRKVVKARAVEYLEVADGNRGTFSSPPHSTPLGKSRQKGTKLTWKGSQKYSHYQVTTTAPRTNQTPSMDVTAATPTPSSAVSRSNSIYSFASNNSSNTHYSGTSSATTPSTLSTISQLSFTSNDSGYKTITSSGSTSSEGSELNRRLAALRQQ